MPSKTAKKNVAKKPVKAVASKPRVKAKVKAKSQADKPLKFVGLPDHTLTDMRLFHRLTNWEEMWREFNLSVNADGRPKYRTIRQFANAKKESEEQGQFLQWFLGAYDEEDPNNDYQEFAGKPLDFYNRRETGGWFSDKALKLISKNVLHGTHALQQIQAAGDDSALHQIYRIERLKQELDASFGGSFFVDGLSINQNTERMRLYLELHGRLDGLSRSAIEQFALTRGINFADLSGYAALMQGLNVQIAHFAGTGQPVQQQSEVESAINQMVKLTMAKSKMYDIPVPKTLEPQTIDVSPEKEEHKEKETQLMRQPRTLDEALRCIAELTAKLSIEENTRRTYFTLCVNSGLANAVLLIERRRQKELDILKRRLR